VGGAGGSGRSGRETGCVTSAALHENRPRPAPRQFCMPAGINEYSSRAACRPKVECVCVDFLVAPQECGGGGEATALSARRVNSNVKL